MTRSPLHSSLDALIESIRSFVRWLALAIASPTLYRIASWWKRDKTEVEATEKPRRPIRDWIRKRRNK